jgi:hypothetical protein
MQQTGGPESVVTMGFHGGPQWQSDAMTCTSPPATPASWLLWANSATLAEPAAGTAEQEAPPGAAEFSRPARLSLRPGSVRLAS